MAFLGLYGLVDEFDQHIQRRDLSPSSARKYCYAVRSALDFVTMLIKRKPRIRELTLDRLQAWIDALRKAGLSPSTLGVKRAALVAFFDFLRWLRRIKPHQDPTCDLLVPSLRRPKKRYMPEEVAMAMVAQPFARLADGEPPTIMALRDRAILWMLYEGGFRAGELATLQLHNLTFDCPKGFVVALVVGKGDKERYVPLAKSMGPLREYLARRSEFAAEGETAVFPHLFTGRQLTSSAISQIVTRYAKRLGIKVNAHLFRHTCGTLTRLEGGDITAIQENFGHDELRTTLTYAGATIKLIIDKALLYHPCNRDIRPQDPTKAAIAQTQGTLEGVTASLARMEAHLQQLTGAGGMAKAA